jgi:tetratricopeptide (TPR) repeat protein
VSNLLIGVLGALVATNQPAALSNLVTQTTGISVTAVGTNNPVEQELHKIEEQDQDASDEVDGWIRQNQEFAAKGAAIPANEMNQRIRNRFDIPRKAYEDFIQRHPDYAPARIAYASFLNDLGDEEGEFTQLLKARDLDPSIPSVWNNLANYYGEHGPLTNAFVCYEKAIQIDPTEPIYYSNFGTTVYLYRKDVKEYYHVNEQQVFDKALLLYSNATRLDPTNFLLASDVAMTYYGIKPLRTNEALSSWTNALSLAPDEVAKEGVYIHFARLEAQFGQFADAHRRLDAVTNAGYAELKRRVARSLNEKEHPELVTNAVPADVDIPTPAVKMNAVKTNTP